MLKRVEDTEIERDHLLNELEEREKEVHIQNTKNVKPLQSFVHFYKGYIMTELYFPVE